jgi:hypothetical protein
MRHDEMDYPGMVPLPNARGSHDALTLSMYPGLGTTAQVKWVTTRKDLATWYMECTTIAETARREA